MAGKQTEQPEDHTRAAAAREDAMLELIDEMQQKIKALEAGGAKVPQKAETVGDQLDTEFQSLEDEFKDYPAISVIARRVVNGIAASADIRLTRDATVEDEAQRYWTLRWFNLGRENRAQEMADRGWERVEWEELQNIESIASGVRQDKFVRRGDRGLEVLGKMPRRLFEHVKTREAMKAQGLLESTAGMRNHLASSVAAMVGRMGGNADQAGTTVNSNAFTVEIKEGPKERITV